MDGGERLPAHRPGRDAAVCAARSRALRPRVAAYHYDQMSPALVVLTGPPLPGRWSLARALQRTLHARRCAADAHVAEQIARTLGRGESVVCDGDLATRAERERLLGATGGPRVLVEWRCGRDEAMREVFHRYASRPDCLARAEFARYLDDAARREPVGGELGERQIVRVGSELSLDEQQARVLAALPEAPARQDATATTRRVLLVEDDADQRAMLADVLGELGLEVELAPDAGVALALLDQGAPVDVLISDHKMPGMSGVELARAVRQRHPDVRTVLLTAYGDEQTCQQAADAEAVTVLAKPLRVIDLARVLEEAQPARGEAADAT